MSKAIFLDRDGTINEDMGYICSPQQFHLIDQAVEALLILQGSFRLFIVTNQSGVARGYFSEEHLKSFNRYVEDLLFKKGIEIQKTYYCPHLINENCVCHKPSSYFLKKAAEEFVVNLRQSYVIGDHPHDVEMAHNVDAKGIYVLTGHGRKHHHELKSIPDHIADNLYDASRWIVENETRKQLF